MMNSHAPKLISYKPFFKLNGKYLIDPETSECEIQNDIATLLETSTATLQTIIEDIDDTRISGALFGVLYQLDMIASLVNAMETKE